MRILLVKTSSLGDVVHNLPVVGDVLHHCPEAIIDWVVEEGFADIPRLHPGVGRVIPVAVRRWRKHLLAPVIWDEIRSFRHQLQSDAYDLVIDTQGLLKSALIAFQCRLSGQGRRCGYDHASIREPLAARFYDSRYPVPNDRHAVIRNRSLVAASVGYSLDSPLDYGVRAAALSASWLPQTQYVVLLTATSRDDKRWPDADWIALGRHFVNEGFISVLPSGNAIELQRAQHIARSIPGAVVAPSLGIPALASLLSGAQRVVGVDTGLTHLAAALGRPTVAIFCASDPGLTGVYAGPGAVNLGQRGLAPDVAKVIAASRA